VLAAICIGLLLCIQGVGAHMRGNEQEEVQRKPGQRAEPGAEAEAGTTGQGQKQRHREGEGEGEGRADHLLEEGLIPGI